jgi:hypothetical protein
MTAKGRSDSTVLRIVAVAVFVAGVALATLLDGWGFWGRLPGFAIAIMIAPWLWKRAGRGKT